MKCTNKKFASITLIVVLMILSLSGCSKKGGDKELWMPFSAYTASERITSGRTSIIEHATYDNRLQGFAADFCVFEGDIKNREFNSEETTASLLINCETNEVIEAENAFDTRYPASLTKLLTAYVALQYLTPDSIITCTNEVTTSITDPDAVLLGLHEGDSMTLDQALRLMLLSSYNDVAVAIGCQISGTVEEFATLLNNEARKLGCTYTQYRNPCGLHEDDHYTTAYDLYLVFKELIKDPYLLEIIQMKEYSTTIKLRSGSEWDVGSKNTNQYFKGNYDAPSNIVVVGGKTGTTSEAGRCLTIMARDTQSTPYIAIILGAKDIDTLYGKMTDLLAVLCDK